MKSGFAGRKILLSLSMIALVGSVAVGATRAYFASPAKSQSNTISSGTMKLLLTDGNETGQVTISDSWEASDLAPGDDIPEAWMTVRNDGNVDGDHLDLAVTYTGNANLADAIIFDGVGTDGLRFGPVRAGGQSVDLIGVFLGGTDSDYTLVDGDNGSALGTIDTTGDGKISLAELVAAGRIRISPAGQNEGVFAGTEAYLWLNSVVDPVILTAQGATVQVTLNWTLHQDASQM